MRKNKKITVKGIDIILYEENQQDYISLTDIARHKDAYNTDDIIKNRMRNRNTIELLGLWEMIYNTGFKPVEFDGFKKQAGTEAHKDIALEFISWVSIEQMKSLTGNNTMNKLK